MWFLPLTICIGSIDCQGAQDYVFWDMPTVKRLRSVKAFNDWLFSLPQRKLPDSLRYEDPWRPYLPDTGKITLTHADLHRGNIIISYTSPPHILAIVDWGMSGWYPDYWEYCKAAYTSDPHGEWLNQWIPMFLAPQLDEHRAFMECIDAIGAV
jgi:hypothetical protein